MNSVDIMLFVNIKIIKLECVRYYQKRVGTQLRNLKKKKGLSGRCRLTDTTIDRLENYEGLAGYSSKYWEPAKYEINFLVSLFQMRTVYTTFHIAPLVPIVGANTMLVEPTYKLI